MGKSTISMAIFNSYFDITRGYLLGHGVKTQPLKSRRIAAESPSSFTHGQCHDAEGKLGD